MNKEDLIRPGKYQSIVKDSHKIKIGKKRVIQSGKIIPTRVNEFLITKTTRKSGNYEIDEGIKLADKKSVPIVLLSDNIEDIFHVYRGRWGKQNPLDKKVILLCTEVNPGMRRQAGVDTNALCNPEECSHWTSSSGRCDWHGVLSCQLRDCPIIGAYARFRTKGFYTIRNIPAALQQISALTGGVLAGINLNLKYYNENVIDAGGNPRQIPVINIEYLGTYKELLKEAIAIQALKNELGVKNVSYSLSLPDKIEYEESSEEVDESIECEYEYVEETNETTPDAEHTKQEGPVYVQSVATSKIDSVTVVLEGGREIEVGEDPVVIPVINESKEEEEEEEKSTSGLVNETDVRTDENLDAYALYLLGLSDKVSNPYETLNNMKVNYDNDIEKIINLIILKYEQRDVQYKELVEFMDKKKTKEKTQSVETVNPWVGTVFK